MVINSFRNNRIRTFPALYISVRYFIQKKFSFRYKEELLRYDFESHIHEETQNLHIGNLTKEEEPCLFP